MAYTYSDQLYSDLHKDATGFRPSQGEYEAWDKKTPDEKQAEWDYLIAELERSIDAEKEAEKRSIEAFEAQVTRITDMLAAGRDASAVRVEVIRQLVEAADVNGDVEFFCYQHGLPYNYLNDVTK